MGRIRTVWDATDFILKEADRYRSAEVLGPGLLDRALDFANIGSDRSVRALLGGFKSAKSALESESSPTIESAKRKQSLQDARSEFRSHLEAVVKATDDVSWRAFVAENARQVILIPKYISRDGRPFAEHRLLPRSLRAALAYVLLLIVDDARPNSRVLCRCRLATCGRFFFARAPESGTGRMRRRYCCEVHMHTAHNRGAADRRRASRAKKAAERGPHRQA